MRKKNLSKGIQGAHGYFSVFFFFFFQFQFVCLYFCFTHISCLFFSVSLVAVERFFFSIWWHRYNVMYLRCDYIFICVVFHYPLPPSSRWRKVNWNSCYKKSVKKTKIRILFLFYFVDIVYFGCGVWLGRRGVAVRGCAFMFCTVYVLLGFLYRVSGIRFYHFMQPNNLYIFLALLRLDKNLSLF